ncbi:uncharacterized protein LOC115318951 [Ixodes scapularis]|uniref:uncharacterized protein LOC115318951 n=1 Tax=Ixodes scapularis TaxID=6945 RepID=UPI001A9CFFDC|nr:uncharacterized protein LOC115318951 [Ixodes scapularis]XP_040069761.1 uncharacterized protein LOC115318951 [Ixodes scapularis]
MFVVLSASSRGDSMNEDVDDAGISCTAFATDNRLQNGDDAGTSRRAAPHDFRPQNEAADALLLLSSGSREKCLLQEHVQSATDSAPAMEVVKSLAALLKDSAACLVEKEDGQDRATYPVMRTDEDSSATTVVLEDHSFEVTDILAGTALVLALYWVHDISYRPKASRSLAVIGHFIGLKYKIKSILALDLITKLETC